VVFTNNTVETDESGTTLATTGGTKGRNKEHITSFKCQEKGHYADTCPNDGKNDESDAANLFIAGVKRESSMNSYSHSGRKE
jgi:hypothetical protein